MKSMPNGKIHQRLKKEKHLYQRNISEKNTWSHYVICFLIWTAGVEVYVDGTSPWLMGNWTRVCDLHCVVQGDWPCRVAANMLPQYQHCGELEEKRGSKNWFSWGDTKQNVSEEQRKRRNVWGWRSRSVWLPCMWTVGVAFLRWGSHGEWEELSSVRALVRVPSGISHHGNFGHLLPLGRNPKSLGSLKNLGDQKDHESPKISLEPWAPPIQYYSIFNTINTSRKEPNKSWEPQKILGNHISFSPFTWQNASFSYAF